MIKTEQTTQKLPREKRENQDSKTRQRFKTNAMKSLKNVYFVGAGGIGMSALVRYCLAKGNNVAGYDKTQTPLTEQLNQEGAPIIYNDDPELIPEAFRCIEDTIIVRTPAVPDEHRGLAYFNQNGFRIIKRAELLGEITQSDRGLCFAGTHGKTTTSTLCAHILKQSRIDCNAFLGGIVQNYDNNLMLTDSNDLVVIEADEYDRSFHQLRPYMATITSTDPDHLDIYGTAEAYRESFSHFTSLIKEGGVLLTKIGIELDIRCVDSVHHYTYSGENEGDFHAENIRIEGGEIHFDFVTPEITIKDIQLGVPVMINIENSIASMAIAWLNGVSTEELRSGTASYKGVKRRFDFHIKTPKLVFLDDYAHHPEEVRASIKSIKHLYPKRELTVIFQPHLYSRTNDFHQEFAKALSLADRVVLLDIYPARELPIAGVSSDLIFDAMSLKAKQRATLNELPEILCSFTPDVLMTLGAGDIDLHLPKLIKIANEQIDKYNSAHLPQSRFTNY